MTTGSESEITNVWVEHMLGRKHGPLVKLRVEGDGIALLGQLKPEWARQIAGHLLEAAARAEYESDLFETMKSQGWEAPMIGAVLAMVRQGEEARHLWTQEETK